MVSRRWLTASATPFVFIRFALTYLSKTIIRSTRSGGVCEAVEALEDFQLLLEL